MNTTHELIDKEVISIVIEKESFSIVLHEFSLVIYNEYDIGNIKAFFHVPGLKIKKIINSDDFMKIFFENKCHIVVYLDIDSYRGPEAMVLYKNGNPYVVWS